MIVIIRQNIGLISATIVLAIALVPAYAHKPLESSGNQDFVSATTIPDHTVSWAIYQNLPSNGADYYRFEGKEGQRFYMQMTVPDMEGHREFAPSVALIGEGMHDIPVENANSKVARLGVEEVQFDIPQTVEGEVLVFDHDSSAPVERFYEPFTQTSYVVRQELTIDSLPSTGTYALVVFDNSPRDEPAKYVLGVGEREEFSVADYFTTLPAAWFQTKIYFEDYLSIAIMISTIVGAIALTLVAVLRKRQRLQTRAR
jgi:hypothetical protein